VGEIVSAVCVIVCVGMALVMWAQWSCDVEERSFKVGGSHNRLESALCSH
jgi:hypothetical protein